MTPVQTSGAARFAEAVTAALRAADRNQAWLGQKVAEIEGRDTPISQGRISQTLTSIETAHPHRVFAIEKALGREPGSLSRLLGYVPADAVPALDVEAAIEADPMLTPSERDMLIAAYRATQNGRDVKRRRGHR